MNATPAARTNYRWIICSLLFFSTTCNYLDRQVISYLKEFFCTPAAQGGFGWSNSDFAFLTSAFTAFYAGMTIVAGWVIDKIGTKVGLALSLIIWSVFGIANAFVGSLLTAHILVRSAFGIGEAGNFPASIKTVAEWFPKRERALATGIFNSGSNFGAMIAALLVPWCMIHYGDQQGWKMAYILTGSVGFAWLIFWFWLYETPSKHRQLSKAEYDYIHIDDESAADQPTGDKAKVSWGRLLGYRQTWSFFFGKFLTDGIWWFYLFWLPDYLKKQFGMSKHDVMLPTFIVYGIAIIGSIGGGSIPMALIKRGMPVYQARMTAMFLIAVLPLSVLSTQFFASVDRFGQLASTLAVAVICLGAGRPSGLVGQSFHHRLRYVPEESRRLRYWHRDHGGWHRRRGHAVACRLPYRHLQGQSPARLPHHVHHLCPELPHRLEPDESPRAEPQADYRPVSRSRSPFQTDAPRDQAPAWSRNVLRSSSRPGETLHTRSAPNPLVRNEPPLRAFVSSW
ncbi:MAG: MFS transporter [Chthoniobacteraceae bacterium]